MGSPLFLNTDGAREICLSEEFFTDFRKTALRPDEILLAIDIPHSKPVRSSKWGMHTEANAKTNVYTILDKIRQVSTNKLKD